MMKNIIPYGKQNINDSDKKAVYKTLSNELITTGEEVQKFENSLKNYLKCKFVTVCNSGTSAIFLALSAINLKEKDIIIMPALNFIASYNMASFFQS